MRIFVAVTIPAEIRNAVAEVQRELKRAAADVKWVDEENFHLTLKFLGEVPDTAINGLAGAIEKAVAGSGGIFVRLSGAGAFPDEGNPRVLWVGVSDGAAELQRLAAVIEEACAPRGFPAEKRSFSGHLTIGRLRSPRNRAALGKRIPLLKEIPAGSFHVSSVEIMQSRLSPRGPHYSCVKSISLSAGTS